MIAVHGWPPASPLPVLSAGEVHVWGAALDGIVRGHFTQRECEALGALREREKLEQFFRGWTLKESYRKAVGDSLTRPLDEVEVDLTRGRPARLLAIGGDPHAASAWVARATPPMRGYVAAVVSEV